MDPSDADFLFIAESIWHCSLFSKFSPLSVLMRPLHRVLLLLLLNLNVFWSYSNVFSYKLQAIYNGFCYDLDIQWPQKAMLLKAWYPSGSILEKWLDHGVNFTKRLIHWWVRVEWVIRRWGLVGGNGFLACLWKVSKNPSL